MKRVRIEKLVVLLALSSLLLTSVVPPAQSRKRLRMPSASPKPRTLEQDSPAAVFRPAAVTEASQGPAASTGRMSVADQGVHARAADAYGKLPLSFEPNMGQAGWDTKFRSRSGHSGISLSQTEMVLSLFRRFDPKTDNQSIASRQAAGEGSSTIGSVVRMRWSGANPAPRMQGSDELPGKSNYFIGDDSEKWLTNIPTYAQVKYEDVYPGVDMVYYGDHQQLEYDFVVAPGADPDSIRISFKGVQRISKDARGDLLLETNDGAIRQRKPVVYQEINGTRQYVAGRYLLTAKHEVGFKIGKYDTSKPLIIDPVLIYSTYLGGAGAETGFGIAVDQAGNTLVTGLTDSLDFPTVNPLQPFRGTNDCFMAKLDPTGTVLLSSTYLGGNGNDSGQAIAVDLAGNIYVAGLTSGNFPILNALQTAHGGRLDAFVTKLNPMGSALIWSTYIGGSDDDAVFEKSVDLAVDGNGNVYLTGRTNSVDFPTVNAVQPTNRGSLDAFVLKINNTGSALVFSTYLGGAREDDGLGIAVNGLGEAYVTGVTFSSDFPTVNPLDATLAGQFDAFVAKFDATGSALVYSTYLGGNDQEDGFGGDIAVDAQGFAYVTGSTGSTDFPTVNPVQATNRGSHDLFITKLTPDGSGIVFSTFLGGAGTDAGLGIAIDVNRNVYVVGFSSATDFPTVNPLSATRRGSSDAIVVKLNATGSTVMYATYYGGSSQETGNAIATDAVGNAYITGVTSSSDVQLANPFQFSLHSNTDSFVAKIFDSSEFSVQAIVSNKGGNSGNASVSILGAGFQSGATVKLMATGQPDIEGTIPVVVNSSKITTTFNLLGATPGLRDVVVTQPGGTTATLLHGFSIEQGGHAQLWVDIIGRDTLRVGVPQSIYIAYGNRGNVNAYGIPLWIAGIPSDAIVNFAFERTRPLPDRPNGQISIDWTQIPTKLETVDGQMVIPLMIPIAPPGTSRMIRLDVTIPSLRTFRVRAALEQPFFQSPLLPAWASCLQAFGENFRDRLIPVQDCLLAAQQLNENDFSESDGIWFYTDFVATYLNLVVQCGGDYTSTMLAESGVGAVMAQAVEFWLDQPLNLYSSLRDERCSDAFRMTQEAIKDHIRVVNSNDPNDKVGAVGAGTSRFLSGEEPLRYAIYFENLPAATAPAQQVVITDQLDLSTLDSSSFGFSYISFGNEQLIPQLGGTEFIGSVDLRPGMNLIVKVRAQLNPDTGLLTWRFSSIDPATGLPPEDPLAGFLAPGEEGSVVFTVSPKTALPTGTVVSNTASVVFDTNAAIQTPTWLNTIDNATPTSHVLPLAATQSSASFNVQWSGSDTGSGIKDYTIFVSRDGQPYTAWLSNVTVTQATFTGQTGSSYSFYAIARDLTGNLEITKTIAEATTQVVANADLSITNSASANAVATGSNVTYTITVSNNGPGAAAPVTVLDSLPAATTLVSCSSTGGQVCGGSVNNRMVNFPTLAPNSSETITIVATLNCAVVDGTQISNTATVNSTTTDPNQSNNSAAANLSAANPPPAIACPANIVQPNDPGTSSAVVNYAMPVAADNCLGVTVSCSNASGAAFPVGATMVTCTAHDSASSQSACSFSVTVRDTEAPRITTCAGNKTLSTNGASQIPLPSLIGEITATDNYTPASALAITQSPAAGTMIGIGLTTVTISVRDAANNASTCNAIVTVSGFSLRDFVVFSSEFTRLFANAKVITGSVGANNSLPDPNGLPDDKEEVEIGERVQMLQAGSSVVGDTLRLRANAQVQNVFFNELYSSARVDIFGGRFTPVSLPALTFPVLPPITPGTQDIEVQANLTRTLAPGRYRKITVKNRGTLILTAGIYEVSSLDIRQDTNIVFKGPAEVRVKNEMDTDARTYIGPDASAPTLRASQIIFYAEGPDDRGHHHDEDEDLTPTVVQIGARNTVLGNIYSPNGTVWLKSNTKATGAFIGKRARVGEGVELKLVSAF